MEACKKEIGSTPAIVRQLFGSRKATAAVVMFIPTTRAGERHQKPKEEEEEDGRKAVRVLEGEQMKGDD